MLKKKQREEEQRQLNDYTRPDEYQILKKKTIKELIAPSGIDATNIDHLEIISNVTRLSLIHIYEVTYQISVELDQLIAEYYKIELELKDGKIKKSPTSKKSKLHKKLN